MDGSDSECDLEGLPLHQQKVNVAVILGGRKRGTQIRFAKDYKAKLQAEDKDHPDLDMMTELIDSGDLCTELMLKCESMATTVLQTKLAALDRMALKTIPTKFKERVLKIAVKEWMNDRDRMSKVDVLLDLIIPWARDCTPRDSDGAVVWLCCRPMSCALGKDDNEMASTFEVEFVRSALIPVMKSRTHNDDVHEVSTFCKQAVAAFTDLPDGVPEVFGEPIYNASSMVRCVAAVAQGYPDENTGCLQDYNAVMLSDPREQPALSQLKSTLLQSWGQHSANFKKFAQSVEENRAEVKMISDAIAGLHCTGPFDPKEQCDKLAPALSRLKDLRQLLPKAVLQPLLFKAEARVMEFVDVCHTK